MFELWKLNRQLRKIQRGYAKDYKKLKKRKASSEEFMQHDSSEFCEIDHAEREIDAVVGLRLYHEARRLDVETPPLKEEQMWYHDEDSNRVWFTSKGRAHVRKLIDEEKARRFDVKTRWATKLILPLLAALIGIIGAITGLVAVLRHAK